MLNSLCGNLRSVAIRTFCRIANLRSVSICFSRLYPKKYVIFIVLLIFLPYFCYQLLNSFVLLILIYQL